MEIREKKIVITGANRGIGRALAEMFAENGAHLHLVVRTSDPGGLDGLKKKGAASVRESRVNLESRSEISKLIEELNKPGRNDRPVDILVNNAGQLTGGLIEEQPLDEILAMFQVNISALVQLTQGLLPGMISRSQGKIINNASVAALMHFPCSSTYSASKAAVMAFTKSLQSELAGTGVSTLLLFTPGVETRMFDEISKKYSKHFNLSWMRAMPADRYAQMVHEAILEDLPELKPPGVQGIGLFLAQHIPQGFQRVVSTRFRRGQASRH